MRIQKVLLTDSSQFFQQCFWLRSFHKLNISGHKAFVRKLAKKSLSLKTKRVTISLVSSLAEAKRFTTLNVHLSYFLGPIKKSNLSVQKWQKVT